MVDTFFRLGTVPPARKMPATDGGRVLSLTGKVRDL